MPEELFDIIDKNGNVIGKEKRSVVHKTGLWHRGAYVFVVNEKREIFIQKRGRVRDFFPNRWDMSVAEHLLQGETYEQGAIRGVQEELGVKVAEIEKIREKEYHFKSENGEDNEINWAFKAKAKGEIKIDKKEIAAGKWVRKEELLRELKVKPEKFTQWVLNCIDLIEKL